MSIASEIARLQGVKSDILQAIADKGVIVPVGSALDDCPSLIGDISGSGNVAVRLQAIVPVSGGIRVCDAYGYVGGNYFGPYYPASYNFYNNFAIVVDGADFSQSGLGNVTLLTPGTDTIGGRTYRTVTMPDGKTWLAENLDFKFSGCDIGPAGAQPTPAAYYYSNNENDYGIDGTYKCGLLYNWHAVNLLETNKADLIPGWHVASKTEWEDLFSSIGGASTAATLLKSINDSVIPGFPSGWGGSDVYQFSVLPGGLGYTGDFRGFGASEGIWTSTPYTSSYSYYVYITTSATAIIDAAGAIADGLYVRLVKDSV